MQKSILLILLLVIILILLLSLLAFYLGIRPYKITSSLTPKDFNIDYEAVQFKTNDNILIKGWFIPNKNPKAKAIILLHGYPADKGNILPSRLFLHDKYHLLFIDFRYLGESEGNYSTLGQKEILDLTAAIHYLHNRHINEVGIWGFSLGAAVALLTVTKAPEIKAIVAEAPYARLDWMVDDRYQLFGLKYIMKNLLYFWAKLFLGININNIQPANVVETIKVPLLLIYSKKDQVINYRHALLMQNKARHNQNVQLIINENTQHGEPMINYQKVIHQFFDKYL